VWDVAPSATITAGCSPGSIMAAAGLSGSETMTAISTGMMISVRYHSMTTPSGLSQARSKEARTAAVERSHQRKVAGVTP